MIPLAKQIKNCRWSAFQKCQTGLKIPTLGSVDGAMSPQFIPTLPRYYRPVCIQRESTSTPRVILYLGPPGETTSPAVKLLKTLSKKKKGIEKSLLDVIILFYCSCFKFGSSDKNSDVICSNIIYSWLATFITL